MKKFTQIFDKGKNGFGISFSGKKPAPVPPEQAQDEQKREYIQYCIELERTLSWLESHLHESDDPEEIGISVLKTACEFYGGDWCGILEVDLDLRL